MSTKIATLRSEKIQLTQEKNAKTNVVFTELEGATLKVGQKKKKKRNSESELRPESSKRKQSKCSARKEQGHIK